MYILKYNILPLSKASARCLIDMNLEINNIFIILWVFLLLPGTSFWICLTIKHVCQISTTEIHKRSRFRNQHMISYHSQEKTNYLRRINWEMFTSFLHLEILGTAPAIFPGRRFILSDVLKPGTLGKIFLKRLKTLIKTLVNDCSLDY